MSLAAALESLNHALNGLEEGLDAALERRGSGVSGREEVHRLNADRAALAGELDVAEDRARRLAEANAEVSRRIVSAMETVRTVLDRA